MGMYTQMHFTARYLKDLDVPRLDGLTARELIAYLASDETDPVLSAVCTELFGSRYGMIMRGGSAYFTTTKPVTTKHAELQFHTSLKNYNSEYQKFLEFISPYVHSYEGTFHGFMEYESGDAPQLIFYIDEKLQLSRHLPWEEARPDAPKPQVIVMDKDDWSGAQGNGPLARRGYSYDMRDNE